MTLCPTPVPVDRDTPVRSAPRRIGLFVNPSAGSWRRKRVAALHGALEAAGAVVTDIARLADVGTRADGLDHICVVGGDGTIRDVVAALDGVPNPPPLSVYPLGTVNLLARECGYSEDVGRFVPRLLAQTASRRHHVARIDKRIMLTCLSVGPDSYTIDILAPWSKRVFGRGGYVLAFGRLFARWPRYPLRVLSDGRDIACEAVYVAKGRYFAGPWSFAPAAALDEPLLHVVALPRATRIAILRFAWDLLRRREPRGAIRFTCASLTISGARAVPVQADGDIVAHLPVEVVLSTETVDFA